MILNIYVRITLHVYIYIYGCKLHRIAKFY